MARLYAIHTADGALIGRLYLSDERDWLAQPLHQSYTLVDITPPHLLVAPPDKDVNYGE